MPIVPVFRLAASPSDPSARYRFSRDAHPDPNPTPGKPDPDPRTRWAVDRVAFYAWSDPVDDGIVNERLRPVYELYRSDERGTVYYRYSTEPDRIEGWKARPYVAFWAYPGEVGGTGVPVYLFEQPGKEGENHALSVSAKLPAPWDQDGVGFNAASTVPIEVSARPDLAKPEQYRWTYTPSTANLAYPCTLQFVQAAQSAWRFTGLEIVGGREDFDPPTVTDRMIMVNARYAHPGRDFKYRVAISPFRGPDKLVGDPEVVNQTPDRL